MDADECDVPTDAEGIELDDFSSTGAEDKGGTCKGTKEVALAHK